jgi:hypothetical protein
LLLFFSSMEAMLSRVSSKPIHFNFVQLIVHRTNTSIFQVGVECHLVSINRCVLFPGDVLLGGFFPIHQPPSYELGSMECTAIKRERGIQRLEAMLFALDVVNQRSSPLMASTLAQTKIRFGTLIYDSCDYESYAIERALNMLLPSVAQCSSSLPANRSATIAGVIGSASSIVSMAIADILRLAQVSALDK